MFANRSLCQMRYFRGAKGDFVFPAILSRAKYWLAPLLITAFSCLSQGCQSEQADLAPLDMGMLLARYEQDQLKHDPVRFSEVDLGQFLITQRHEPAIYYVRFHLFGVVPDEQMAQFDEALKLREARVRSTIRSTVQNSELGQLADPSLGWLKSELISQLNRSLQARILRDVVFTDFSFEKG